MTCRLCRVFCRLCRLRHQDRLDHVVDMRTRSNPSTDLKTETLSVSVSLDAKEQLRRAAEANDETVADFVREAIWKRVAFHLRPLPGSRRPRGAK